MKAQKHMGFFSIQDRKKAEKNQRLLQLRHSLESKHRISSSETASKHPGHSVNQ